MRYLMLLLLFIPSIANAQLLVITLCGDPVVFIYDHKNKTHVVPIQSMNDKHAKLILPQLEPGKFHVIESEHLSDRSVCGVNI